jgi:hypothetical protein
MVDAGGEGDLVDVLRGELVHLTVIVRSGRNR